jgi:hypothetical protein
MSDGEDTITVNSIEVPIDVVEHIVEMFEDDDVTDGAYTVRGSWWFIADEDGGTHGALVNNETNVGTTTYVSHIEKALEEQRGPDFDDFMDDVEDTTPFGVDVVDTRGEGAGDHDVAVIMGRHNSGDTVIDLVDEFDVTYVASVANGSVYTNMSFDDERDMLTAYIQAPTEYRDD